MVVVGEHQVFMVVKELGLFPEHAFEKVQICIGATLDKPTILSIYICVAR